MSMDQESRETARLRARNVGGIDETAVEFAPGVTILEGRNATNRTSLLQALMAVCGSDDVSVKADADEARVDLDLDGETHTRRVTRTESGLRTDGDPYLADPTLADLFAFLLESNEARRAVARGDDLRELIMRPIDTEEIQAEIERLVAQRRDLDAQLEELAERKGELPDLEAERTRLREEIEAKREELAAKEAEIESLDASVEESRETNSEVEERLGELRDCRSSLEETRYSLETERERLDALQSERADLRSELADLEETPVGALEEFESELGRLREEKQSLEVETNELQSVIGFNEEMLESADHEVFAAVGADSPSDAVTDELLAEDEVTCWTCGAEVDREQIRATLDQLRGLSSAKFEEISALDDRLEELKAEQRALRDARQRRERVERRLEELADEIETQQETITNLEARRDELREEIESIETTVEKLQDDSRSELLDRHREANQLEYETGRLESDLEDVEAEIETIEAELGREDDIEAERAELQSTIEDRRTAIDRIEQRAIDAFNEHMDTVLGLLDYRNLERIWLERTEREVRDGRRTVTESTFELHVVRSTSSGTSYEDTVDHLSESEREVTGLVFALAGYLVHDVHETVPFMLLDSLEAIDAERIAALVDYLAGYSRYLVVALLPGDAAALDDDYRRVTEI